MSGRNSVEVVATILSLYIGITPALVLVILVKMGRRRKKLDVTPAANDQAEAFFEKARQRKAELETKKYLSEQPALISVQSTEPSSATPNYQPISFTNLVLEAPSSNTPHTEIDQVIVWPYGIFCIEYKAHVGIIFGTAKNKWWTQCRYDGRYRRHNPLHQNYKHVMALRHLLGDQVKAPIHSFVVYTNAEQVHVDSRDVFSSIDTMQVRIDSHSRQVYSLDEWQSISRTLAVASSKSADLFDQHVQEVSSYLATLPA